MTTWSLRPPLNTMAVVHKKRSKLLDSACVLTAIPGQTAGFAASKDIMSYSDSQSVSPSAAQNLVPQTPSVCK